jgi:hypothetical protein
MADAQVSKTCEGNLIRVRLPFPAPMLLAIFLIFSLFLIILIFFSFPQFSLIPYFPTNKKDLPKIIETLKLKNNQTIIDLGAGDGLIVFSAAKDAFDRKLNTKFIAVDTNPILIIVLFIRKLLHPNRNNISIVFCDMFKYKFEIRNLKFKNVTIYLYISPWLLEKIVSKIKKEIKGCNIVSYYYPIKSLKKKEEVFHGHHSIFNYGNI